LGRGESRGKIVKKEPAAPQPQKRPALKRILPPTNPSTKMRKITK